MKKTKDSSRRTFIKNTTIASSAILFPAKAIGMDFLKNELSLSNSINVSVFSKALQFLDYKDMSEVVKEMGFDGVDLTVRPKGHVLPESAIEDLPKATEAMKSFGLSPNLFSTGVSDANDAIDKQVLETASQLGFKNYRTAWFKYKSDKDILETLEFAKQQLIGLGELNKTLNISGGYQNHSGHYFGSGIWDIYEVLKPLSPNHIGSQYDISHATVEGGKNWGIGFRLIKPHINSIVLKDFIWMKKKGKWKAQYVPLGEGMVDFNRFFSLLKEHQINVPISIHVEYDLGGAEKGRKPTIKAKEIFKKIKKDLDFARKAYADA